MPGASPNIAAAILMTSLLWSTAAHAAKTAELQLCIEGLRSQRGMIRLCMMRQAANFPNCEKSAGAIRQSFTIGTAPNLCVELKDIEPGTYGIALFHDENLNERLDTTLAIPREGFGFSRNPRVRFGPPSFERASIVMAPDVNRQSIRMQYLL